MFGTIRNLAARAKAAVTKARVATQQPTLNIPYQGAPVLVVTRRQQMALRLAAAVAKRTGCHSYIPPTFEFAHTEGRKDRSQKIRGNKRKAAR